MSETTDAPFSIIGHFSDIHHRFLLQEQTARGREAPPTQGRTSHGRTATHDRNGPGGGAKRPRPKAGQAAHPTSRRRPTRRERRQRARRQGRRLRAGADDGEGARRRARKGAPAHPSGSHTGTPGTEQGPGRPALSRPPRTAAGGPWRQDSRQSPPWAGRAEPDAQRDPPRTAREGPRQAAPGRLSGR